MSAPFTVRWGWCLQQESGPYETLDEAIAACKAQRAEPWAWLEPQVHGDNYDVDNPIGLSKAEDERVMEALG